MKAEHIELSKVKKAELFDFIKGTRNKEEYSDSIIEDFRTSLLWSKDSELDVEPICQLNKVLEQESHDLRFSTNESFAQNEDVSILFAQ